MFSNRVSFFGEIPLSVTNSTVTALGGGSYTLSAIVGGTIPLNAFTVIQWAPDPNVGPWTGSPGDTTVIGVYSHTFTGIPSSSTIYWRTFILTPPAEVQAVTPNSSFTT